MTPRYNREKATDTSSTATAYFAISRRRPGTTREYTIPSRQTARVAKGNDGMANPSQSPMMVRPFGRGRDMAKYSRLPSTSSAVMLPRTRLSVRRSRWPVG